MLSGTRQARRAESTASSVGEVAALAHVSVRTLHHYDEIGLLSPSRRSDAGYRLYDSADLERLQQILFYRELGFALALIKRIMLDPTFDRAAALRSQRELLAQKAERASALLRAIDDTIESTERGMQMDKEEMFEVFGDFDPAQYEDEVKERWGDTDAYKESARRTARYTKEDWKRFKAESEEITSDLIALFDSGLPPTDPQVLDVVERHRRQISDVVLRVLPRDAREPRQDVRRRSAVHQDLRGHATRSRAVRVRRQRRQRRTPDALGWIGPRPTGHLHRPRRQTTPPDGGVVARTESGGPAIPRSAAGVPAPRESRRDRGRGGSSPAARPAA